MRMVLLEELNEEVVVVAEYCHAQRPRLVRKLVGCRHLYFPNTREEGRDIMLKRRI